MSSKSASDKFNEWIDNNTGIFGTPTPWHDRALLDEEARQEQIDFVCEKKRYIYRFWYEQPRQTDDHITKPMSLGTKEVNNREELYDLVVQLEKQYNGKIIYEFERSRW
jgi:hypothetical protein